jgi:Putative transmembrane protein (PGPGW)
MPPSDDPQELFASSSPRCGPSVDAASDEGGLRTKEVLESATLEENATAEGRGASRPYQQAKFHEEESGSLGNGEGRNQDGESVGIFVDATSGAEAQQEPPSKKVPLVETEETVQNEDPVRTAQDATTTSKIDEHEHGAESLASTRTDDVVAFRRQQRDEAARESTNTAEDTSVDPLTILRKGAVAAVGGAMVGVGLIMIPLPTPFGAVVASSGLAVLGTEFEGAREMNERLIEGAKSTMNTAREHLVRTIESMEQEDFDDADDESTDQDSHTTCGGSNYSDDITNDGCAVPTIIATASDSREKEGDAAVVADLDDEGNETVPPSWLHMNPLERERQWRLTKENYRRETQTAYEQTKQYLSKSTAAFLSKNVLPLLKTEETTADDGETQDGNENGETDTSKNSSLTGVGENMEDSYVMVSEEEDDVTAETAKSRAMLSEDGYEKGGEDRWGPPA